MGLYIYKVFRNYSFKLVQEVENIKTNIFHYGRGSVPNVEYAPKLEYLDILESTVDISELVYVRGGDKQMLSTCNRMNVCEECSLFYSIIFIFLVILIFL